MERSQLNSRSSIGDLLSVVFCFCFNNSIVNLLSVFFWNAFTVIRRKSKRLLWNCFEFVAVNATNVFIIYMEEKIVNHNFGLFIQLIVFNRSILLYKIVYIFVHKWMEGWVNNNNNEMISQKYMSIFSPVNFVRIVWNMQYPAHDKLNEEFKQVTKLSTSLFSSIVNDSIGFGVVLQVSMLLISGCMK